MSELYNHEIEETESMFHVKDDMTAEWCMTQIRNAQAEKAKWKQFYEERIQSVNEACDLTIANMEAMLHAYFDSVPHKVTKTQENYALPSGKLVVKKQEPEYERDDEALIAWLKANGGDVYVKTKESVDWAALKGTLTVMDGTVADADGQIIPCVKATERPDVFKVELKKTKEEQA